MSKKKHTNRNNCNNSNNNTNEKISLQHFDREQNSKDDARATDFHTWVNES